MKRAIDSFKKSDAIFRLAMESAPIGKALVSTEGKFLYVNNSLCKIVGYSEEELLATDFQTITHPDDLELDLNYVRQMLNKEIQNYQMEKRYYHKDGYIVWILLSGSLVWNKDGTPHYFIAQIQDITKRKYAEDKFRVVFENSSDPHLIINNQKITDCNDVALRILGFSSKSILVGKTPVEISPYLQSDKKSSSEKLQTIINQAHKEGFAKCEWLYRKISGEELPVEMTLTFIEIFDKKELLMVWHDLTEIKKAEREREELVMQLVESNSELERFAFVASHDLREPMRLICNMADLLQGEYSNKLDTEGVKYINSISNAASRMHKMVGSLLDYARIGHDTEKNDYFDSKICLEFAQENLSQIIYHSKALIKSVPMPNIYANQMQFSLLLQNLISNGIKYAKKETQPIIDIAIKEDENSWIFSVSDNGIGIHEHYHKQIFEPFKRLHTLEEYEGAGMGLAICRKIVEKMKGNIWLDSSPGTGSTFYFTVPKANAYRAGISIKLLKVG